MLTAMLANSEQTDAGQALQSRYITLMVHLLSWIMMPRDIQKKKRNPKSLENSLEKIPIDTNEVIHRRIGKPLLTLGWYPNSRG